MEPGGSRIEYTYLLALRHEFWNKMQKKKVIAINTNLNLWLNTRNGAWIRDFSSFQVNNIPTTNLEEELVKPENRPLDSMATYNYKGFLLMQQMYNFSWVNTLPGYRSLYSSTVEALSTIVHMRTSCDLTSAPLGILRSCDRAS